jgi:hypothetical protein
MNLPCEIIELIASSLLQHDYQYKCLTVSSQWYGPVHRALYKSIYVKTRHQLKLLLKALLTNRQQGLLVRQVYLNKSINGHIVGITTQELDQLTMLCPFMEVLDFDQKLWKYIQFPSKHQLHRLPTLTQLKTLSQPSISGHLKQLSLHGELVSQLFNNNADTGMTWISLLQQTPQLTKLCLDSSQTKSHTIPLSLYDMETLHNSVPLLDHLELVGSFRFLIIDPTTIEQVVQPTLISILKLQATIPSPWIYYMAQKYPQLQRLNMEALPQPQDKKPSLSTPTTATTNSACWVFFMLLRCCPRLRQLELDSDTAQKYLTPTFFTLARTHGNLCQIHIKDLPYHVLSRDSLQAFADSGCDLITGLSTEVIGTDLDITNILKPLSKLSQLTHLALCCGHPYFDCPLDLVLDQCPTLTSLTVRSAHLTVLPSSSNKRQHHLKSLHLSTVSFDSTIFDYMGQYCLALNQLHMYECDQTNERSNVLRLYMPQNAFDLIKLNAIRVVPQQNVRIVSLIQTTQRRWYHATSKCHPKLQRFNDRRSTLAQQYFDHGIPLQHNNWQKDLALGHITIECQSVQKWELICSNNTFNEF